MMVGTSISDVLANPLLQDNAYNVWIYLGIALMLLIISFLLVVFYNLNDTLKKNK